MSNYQFPMLSPEEIVSFFREIIPEMGMTEADLANPAPTAWARHYTMILENMVGTSQEQLNQQQIHASGSFEHPEIFEESACLVTLAIVMNKFLGACGVEDFQLKDILQPKPKRTKRIVSAVINFQRFQGERMQFYESVKQETEDARHQYEQLKKKIDEEKSLINNLKASRAEQEPEINQLLSKMEEKSQEMGEHHKAKAAIQKDINDIKVAISERKAAIDQTKQSITQGKEVGAKLSGQIVQSPERMKKDQERMHHQLQQLKLQKEERLQRHLELRKHQEARLQVENDCEQGLKLIQGINGELEKERQVLSEIENVREQSASLKDGLRDMTAKEQQLKRVHHSKQEKMSKITLQHHSKMQGTKESIQHYQGEKQRLLETNSEEEKLIYSYEQEIQKIKDEMSEQGRVSDDKMDTLRDQYSSLLEQLDQYHTRLGTAWETASQAFKS